MLSGYVNLPKRLESVLSSSTPEISSSGNTFTYSIKNRSLSEELKKIVLSNKVPVVNIKIDLSGDGSELLIKGPLTSFRDVYSGYTVATIKTGLLDFGVSLHDETPEYILVVIALLGEM